MGAFGCPPSRSNGNITPWFPWQKVSPHGYLRMSFNDPFHCEPHTIPQKNTLGHQSGEPANKGPVLKAWAFLFAKFPLCRTQSEDSADQVGGKAARTCCVRESKGVIWGRDLGPDLHLWKLTSEDGRPLPSISGIAATRTNTQENSKTSLFLFIYRCSFELLLMTELSCCRFLGLGSVICSFSRAIKYHFYLLEISPDHIPPDGLEVRSLG